jgi:hypothetical protein
VIEFQRSENCAKIGTDSARCFGSISYNLRGRLHGKCLQPHSARASVAIHLPMGSRPGRSDDEVRRVSRANWGFRCAESARDRRILALQATGTAEGNSRWPLRQLSRSCYLINSDMVFLHYDRSVSVSRTARMRGGALRPLSPGRRESGLSSFASPYLGVPSP